MSLSLGILKRGWHDGLPVIGNALSSILNVVADEDEKASIADQPIVNVVFHLPGDLHATEHLGIRTGSLFKKERGKMIQVGVPEEIMNSPDPSRYIFDMIKGSIDAAIPAFQKQGWNFSREDHMRFVDHVEKVWRAKGGLKIPPL